MARAATEYLLLSKRTRQVLDTEACVARNPSNRLLIGTSLVRSASNLPDRPVGHFRMPVGLGVSDTPVEQLGVQLLITRDTQPWGEQPLTKVANLVLYLSLLPPGRGVQAVGSTR